MKSKPMSCGRNTSAASVVVGAMVVVPVAATVVEDIAIVVVGSTGTTLHLSVSQQVVMQAEIVRFLLPASVSTFWHRDVLYPEQVMGV